MAAVFADHPSVRQDGHRTEVVIDNTVGTTLLFLCHLMWRSFSIRLCGVHSALRGRKKAAHATRFHPKTHIEFWLRCVGREQCLASTQELIGTWYFRQHKKLALQSRTLREFLKQVFLGIRMFRRHIQNHLLQLWGLSDMAEHFAPQIVMGRGRMPDIPKNGTDDSFVGK